MPDKIETFKEGNSKAHSREQFQNYFVNRIYMKQKNIARNSPVISQIIVL